MAVKRVIAYYMHEFERDTAKKLMPFAEVTDSFAIGEVDENDIPKMQDAGLIVQEQFPVPPPDQAADSTRGIRAARRLMSLAAGTPASSLAADTVAIPAPVDYYFIRLRGPLVESWRKQLEGLGITLLERLPEQGYKARLRTDQVPQTSGLNFVESVRWITPTHSSAQIMTLETAAPGQQEAAGRRTLIFDVRLHVPEERAKVEEWLRNNHVAIVGSSGRKIRIHVLEASPVLGLLARLPEVDTMAEYVPPKLCNDHARRILAAYRRT